MTRSPGLGPPEGPAGCGCHPPGRDRPRTVDPAPAAPPSPTAAHSSWASGTGEHLVPQATIPAGIFVMGDSSGDRNPMDGEVPLHEVALDAFTMDATTVTNDDFAGFTAATGYVTEAERFGVS
ncbi:MAG: SUMF1/EgtB/PvdO family nonheme iron enzyme, partial [Brachybacterium sp.]|nr:SUMF1/EgtB/PvdO family nonheme iron enzyme [Brachybacterium sp.]